MKNPKVLIARTDRLGDVLLSLPSLEFIRKNAPNAEIDFLVQPLYVPVLKPLLDSLRIHPVENVEKDYSHFLALFCGKHLAWKCFKRGVKFRVGNRSKPWSFFLFNEGVRQRRSKAEKNEAEYNLDLAQILVTKLTGKSVSYVKPTIEIPTDEDLRAEAEDHLRGLGIDPLKSFTVFHPGMRGSALNLNPNQYLELLDLAEKNWVGPVLLSIGPVLRDQEMSETLLKAKPYLKVIRNLEIAVLREVFRLAKVVVAPSTGPLHLAHYVGTRTVGIYPPVQSQNATRWAPWGGTGSSTVVFPKVECPGKFECLGQSCKEFFCMDKNPWNRIFSDVAGGS